MQNNWNCSTVSIQKAMNWSLFMGLRYPPKRYQIWQFGWVTQLLPQYLSPKNSEKLNTLIWRQKYFGDTVHIHLNPGDRVGGRYEYGLLSDYVCMHEWGVRTPIEVSWFLWALHLNKSKQCTRRKIYLCKQRCIIPHTRLLLASLRKYLHSTFWKYSNAEHRANNFGLSIVYVLPLCIASQK